MCVYMSHVCIARMYASHVHMLHVCISNVYLCHVCANFTCVYVASVYMSQVYILCLSQIDVPIHAAADVGTEASVFLGVTASHVYVTLVTLGNYVRQVRCDELCETCEM